MEMINLQYTMAGDHLENILNCMTVRRVISCISGKRPQGHAGSNVLAQACLFWEEFDL